MILKQEFKPGPNCPRATLEVLNARMLRIISPGNLYLSSGILYSDDSPIASEGSGFTFLATKTKKVTYQIQTISLGTPHTATLSTERRNMTSMFLLPTIETDQSKVSYDTYLINAYTPRRSAAMRLNADLDNTHLNLVYRYFPLDAYRELEEGLKAHSEFISIMDYMDKVVVTMSIPERFRYDVELLLNGKYSKLGKELKSRILKFHRVGKGSNLYSILHKEESYRLKLSKDLGFDISSEAELYDLPVMQEEQWIM